MNPDDIVFEDVTYREPRRQRRPDRDPARACIAYAVLNPADLPIFLDLKTADAIERHALSDTSVELGGILLGRECLDDQTGEPFVWITESIEAQHYESTPASFTYTHESWEAITRERDRRFPDLDMVGWYHTHPDFGVFLSGHDLFIHNHFFARPLQVAYVVDPIRQMRGFFRWNDGRVELAGGFFVTAPRAQRLALARFLNDLENLPTSSEAGTGGLLSPRLEAELIAMLRNPRQAVAPAAALQSAAVFTVLGIFLGMLLLAGGLGVSSLGRAMNDQAESLQAQAQSLAALNQALGSIRIGDEPFLKAYDRTARELDKARAQVQYLTADKEALDGRVIALKADLDKIKSERDDARTRLDLVERAIPATEPTTDPGRRSGELLALDVRVARLGKAKQAADRRIEQLEDDLKALGQVKSGNMPRKYGIAWYTAAASLGACVLLGLALVWAATRNAPGGLGPPGNPAHESQPDVG